MEAPGLQDAFGLLQTIPGIKQEFLKRRSR